ncbi:hypothetical protein EIN_323570 [Entamoeba invadens IP1]|uniref:Uncharacterized protein n=1 Tax=Entamoeba invadens IP1 TaxID=370355 RepID=L7FMI6_ENTIV|nr:hypothetical protein EIN_323570 [Entamoeba invadens IP1]ELP89314.1 hypothetical protein EIN_323570 [Entamoeba invadens IP1]|eukprot:XP_004256085.1 hypothetical protein EIN_323570 [Entamoeba invadens IP1]
MYDISDNNRCSETNKPFDDFYVPNLIGVHILSMSKRIMNEVMCLAEDLNIDIYYQDTDSMHIDKNKIELLEQKYKEIYGKTLRGSKLEQFHPNFDELSGYVYSKESYFLGKKAYIDVLTNEKQKHALHMKMKGIPNNLLENYINSSKSLHSDSDLNSSSFSTRFFCLHWFITKCHSFMIIIFDTISNPIVTIFTNSRFD